ncbi:MAG: type II toxin-antitoxin system VapC family toxin [Opitutaceae bacterium]
MIAIDTNLLVRHLTQDDAAQAARVTRLFAEAAANDELVLLTDIVLCETSWVLTRFYGVKRADLVHALERMLADAQFAFQHRPEVEGALRAWRTGRGHFADHLIASLARGAGCRTTYTFEKGLSAASGFTQL